MDRWLIVGLANPEGEYGGTRHNIGADTVRLLADRLGVSFKPHKAQVLAADTWTPSERSPGRTPVTLAIPFGYMNNSGGPVQRAMAFYKVPLERVVVIHDELDLELAVVRLKRGGGPGGHNGVKDVINRCGRDFLRVRIGIGRPPGRQDPADYVLKRFSSRDREAIDVAIAKAADATLDLLALGLEAAQNRHHAG